MEKIHRHLVFRIKNQLFTVHVSHAKSIIKLPSVFKVPQASQYILGVINVDGDVIPVMDAAIKINMGVVEINDQSQVIIMQKQIDNTDKYQYVGFLVHEVCDVTDIDPLRMQALPVSKYGFDDRQVIGMHKIENDFCMQINVPAFFNDHMEGVVAELS